MSSPIIRLPLEILEKIVLNLIDEPSTSPSALLPLLLTSHHFHDRLAFPANTSLYARIFRTTFDSSVLARRLGDFTAASLTAQLHTNHKALKSLRLHDIHAHDVLDTFRTCFAMLIENDGKNRYQLEQAGLPDFVDSFVRERLYQDAPDGWPADNEINSLALWLLWLSHSEDRLRAQTSAQRTQMIRLVLPFVLMPVRYAAYLAPHVYFTVPIPRDPSQLPHTFHTAHGPYLHYHTNSYASRTMPLYHLNAVRLGIPLATVAAKLIYFSHREVFPIAVPPVLPRNRAHALQLGFTTVGPTQEDIQELNEHKIAKFVPTSPSDWWSQIQDHDLLPPAALSRLAPSARWDDDWNRLADCNSVFNNISLKRTHHTPGLLSGLWQGRMLYPDSALHENIMQTHQMPSNFSEQSVGLAATPVFMRLREYHCMDVDLNQAVASGGIQNAWFPNATRFQEVTHGLAITCQERTSFYNEFIVGGPDLHDESKCRGCKERGTSDMIFRENDERYLSMNASADEGDGMDDDDDDDDDEVMDDDASDADADADADMERGTAHELEIRRKCDGILDIVLVGETDVRHGQAWHHYKFYGRVRQWDGLVALIRVPAQPTNAPLGVWVFTGYVVGGQNFVGNWRETAHPGEPVPLESAFAMSKRE